MLQTDRGALPMRFSYGPRYNPSSDRMDSPQLKSTGFYGPLTIGPDNVASEYSIGSEIGEYPSIAQNMPPNLLAQSLSAAAFHQPVPGPAADFAERAAANRMSQGRSPFWEQGKDPYPAWSPDQHWEKPAIMPEHDDNMRMVLKDYGL